jgi:hypothetical protein
MKKFFKRNFCNWNSEFRTLSPLVSGKLNFIQHNMILTVTEHSLLQFSRKSTQITRTRWRIQIITTAPLENNSYVSQSVIHSLPTLTDILPSSFLRCPSAWPALFVSQMPETHNSSLQTPTSQNRVQTTGWMLPSSNSNCQKRQAKRISGTEKQFSDIIYLLAKIHAPI